MILPILAYGHPNLRKMSEDISPDYPNLSELIANMWDTMYNSSGVGLAAPQVNRQIRLFVIDAAPYAEDDENAKDFKKVFINAHIIDKKGEEYAFKEGCLSVPEINEEVMRAPEVLIRYVDNDFIEHEEWFHGILARIIQHEYDHLDGILFVDKMHSLRKIMNKGRLQDIAKGKITPKYRMSFPSNK